MLTMVKLMRKKLLPVALFWFLAMCSAMAQGPLNPATTACELPPPDSLWFPTVTPTSITAEWSPVPGAVEYRVTIEDPLTLWSNSVVTPLTTHTFTGLAPGTEYIISVSATACENGAHGPVIFGPISTSYIIITDVIIQRCDKVGEPESRGAGTFDNFVFNNNGDQYIIDVKEAGNSNVRHHFIVEADMPNNQILLQNYAVQGLTVPGGLNSNGAFEVISTNSKPFYTLDNISFHRISPYPTAYFTITWEVSVELQQYYCPCEENNGRSYFPKPEQSFPELSAAPVPFQDYLRVTWPQQESGRAANLLLTDMAGKIVARQTSADGMVMWPTESLPSGIYLLHFDDGNLRQTRKLVKAQ